MLRETHDLALVQDLLGHASPASTRIYAKIYPDDLEKAHKQVWEKPDPGDGLPSKDQ
jgi:site-specific recombinase XerD